MKVIVIKYLFKVPKNFNGICTSRNDCVFYFKNGKYHNKNGAANHYQYSNKDWCYKGILYGTNNDFTNETWKKKVKELKRQEKLKIFK